MRFDLTILGCNSAIPANNRFPSSQILNVQERVYLIDCGEGTQVRLSENHIRRNRINQIFISHLHGDHIFGLIGLLTTMSLLGRKDKIQVFSPPGLKEIIEVQLLHTEAHMDYQIAFKVLDPSQHSLVFEDEALEVYSIPLVHRIPTCGYLFREKAFCRNIRPESIKAHSIPFDQIKGIKAGADFTMADGQVIANSEITLPPYQPRSYAYCSDTTYQENIVPWIQGADLLYHETTFLHDRLEQAIQTKHSTALQAAMIAQKAAVGQLITGHYSSRYKDLKPFLEEARKCFINTQLGLEGRTFSVPLQRIGEEAEKKNQ